jgi:hypothetical protein
MDQGMAISEKIRTKWYLSYAQQLIDLGVLTACGVFEKAGLWLDEKLSGRILMLDFVIYILLLYISKA